MKFGSLLSAGAFLPIPLVSGLSDFENDKPYTVGILGYGDRGSGLHRVLSTMPKKFQVTDICDNLDFRLANAKKNFPAINFRFYKDYRKMMDRTDLDVIVVATPLYLHYEHAKAVLEAGKHLYLEKTMTFIPEETYDLISLSQMHDNQIIQVGHQYRYSPLYYKVKEMIDNDYLGKVTQIEARWDRNHSWRRPVPSPDLERQINWRMYKEYSGGLAAELLSHQMDFVHWAFDCVPSSIYGTGGIDMFKDGRETFDNIQVAVRYGNKDMIGNFGATCSNQHEGYSFKIKGSKGMVSLLMDDGIFYPEPDQIAELQEVDGISGATKLNWSDNKKGIKLVNEPLKDGSFYAMEDFHRCLQEKSIPHSNLINGGKTAIAIALANKSLDEGGEQHWESKYNFLENREQNVEG